MLTKTRVVRWLEHVGGDAVDDLAELLGGGHRRQLGLGELDGDVEPPGVPAVDDGGGSGRPDPAQEAGRVLDGSLGGRQADALGPGPELEVLEALEGEGQVRAPLVPGQGVDLVHDHRLPPGRARPGCARR